MNFRCPACGVEFVQPAKAREIESLKKEVEELKQLVSVLKATTICVQKDKVRLRSALEQARERLDCVPQGDSLLVDEAYKDIEEALGNAQTEEK